MKMPRSVLFGFRLLFAFYLLLTATYFLLAYIPFTYQQVVAGGLFVSFTAFAKLNSYLYWPAFALAAVTLVPDLRERKTRVVSLVFVILFADIGILLLIHPVLTHLGNNRMSLVWALASLAPLWGVAAIDWLGHSSVLQWSKSRNGEEKRIFRAALESAVYLAIIYAGISYLRPGGLGEAGFGPQAWFFSLLWTIVSHLAIFMTLFVILDLAGTLASLFPIKPKAEFLIVAGLAVLLLLFVLMSIVFPPISFDGLLAFAVALAVSVSVVTFWTGLCIRLYRPENGALESGLALMFVPLRSLQSLPRSAWIWILAAIPGIAFILESRTSLMDWEFLAQEIAALFIWTLTFAVFYTMARRSANGRRTPYWLLLAATASLCAYLLLLFVQPQMHILAKGNRVYASNFLDEYADYDISFRLSRDMVSRANPSFFGHGRSAGGFYHFLDESTNIPRSRRVAPISVNLVAKITPASPPKPNIFIFVIDSLRRDYVGAYNPRVTFTPSIDAFARESVVMRNAFTRYGGTGLSEPSIWVGGLVLHKQYVTPFYPMNSLEKLLEKEGYQSYISKDEILRVILGPMPSLTPLDKNIGTMNYNLCRTLKELQIKLLQRSDPSKPIFVYTQPQNIHISVINREGRSVPPGEHYPGFDAAYASRLRRVDSCFGKFIQFLKKVRLFDDSVIILTSDHGDSLGERGRWGHAYTIFPEVIRIPLIIHLPLTLQGTLHTNPNSVAFLTDITPTLYYMLGQNPIIRNGIFGRPLFTASLSEQAPYLSNSYMVASSYGPVYGILTNRGHTLYIADGVNYRDYLFHMGEGSGATSEVVTHLLRSVYQQKIRQDILDVDRFYKFVPGR